MKKTLLLLFTMLLLNCSGSDDSDISIVGKWVLNAQIDDNGVNLNIDDCVKLSNITFKNDNTFDLNNYKTINNRCILEDEETGSEYSLDKGVLEIRNSFTNGNGQTEIDINKINLIFVGSNTFELSEDNSQSKEVWIRSN